MGLDFIEIGREEYDFAIPVRFLDFPPVQHFLAVLKSGSLQREWRSSVVMGWQEPEKFYIYKEGIDGSSCA